MDNREISMQSAIGDLNSGIFKSIRKAAEAYNIPRSTLQARIKGCNSRAISHQQQQRLTPEQETFLVDWILDEDSRAHSPSHP